MYRLSKKLDEVKRKLCIDYQRSFENVQVRKQYFKQELEAIEQGILWNGRDKEIDSKEKKILQHPITRGDALETKI